MSAERAPRGPVAPTPAAVAALTPLPVQAVRITGGPWELRQRVNRETSLPIGAQRLHEAGNLEDLQLAAEGRTDGEYRGPLFMDSDVYKWLEAVAWEHAREPAPALLAEFRKVAAAVVAAQQEDGYINSFVQVTRGGRRRYQDLAFSHELYCMGHLIQAAVAARRTTGDIDLWDVAVHAADHLVQTFGPGRNEDIDGHPIIEMALVELFRESGERRYLDLASWFVDRRGHGTNHAYGREPIYFSDRVPVRTADSVEGHAVRALYLAAGVCDVATEASGGDQALLAAQERQWDHMVATKTYLTGGLGSRWDGEAFGDPYELPPDVGYCETCAAIAAVQWSWRRLLATGAVRNADLIERILGNGFLGGVSLSGDEFFYVNALQVRTGAVPDDHRQPAAGRQGWFQTACCPPNIMRMISSLSAYVATADSGGLQVHQYAPGHIDSVELGVDVDTDYPWGGRVTITVTTAPDAERTLAVRVPPWATQPTVAVGDAAPSAATVEDGYIRTTRRWNVGDRVVLELPMAPRLTAADPRVDAVRGTLALERGPLVYAIEQVDLPEGTVLENLDLRDTDAAAFVTTPRPDLLGGIVTVRVPLRDRTTGGEVDVQAVPYATWANRGVGPMRVWLPTTGAAGEVPR